MADVIVGGLLVGVGVLAAWMGLAAGGRALRSARRSYHRMSPVSAATSEDWGAWFLGGFSGVTMGLRGLIAAIVWLAWTLAGVGFIGLGIQFFEFV